MFHNELGANDLNKLSNANIQLEAVDSRFTMSWNHHKVLTSIADISLIISSLIFFIEEVENLQTFSLLRHTCNWHLHQVILQSAYIRKNCTFYLQLHYNFIFAFVGFDRRRFFCVFASRLRFAVLCRKNQNCKMHFVYRRLSLANLPMAYSLVVFFS